MASYLIKELLNAITIIFVRSFNINRTFERANGLEMDGSFLKQIKID